IRLDLEARDVWLARNIPAGALHAVLDGHTKITADGREKFEAMDGIVAAVGCNVVQRERLRDRQDFVADLARIIPMVRFLVLFPLPGMPYRENVCRHLACEGFLGNW